MCSNLDKSRTITPLKISEPEHARDVLNKARYQCIIASFIEIQPAVPLKVLRQDQEILVNAVKELCDGQPSAETCHFLRTLDRPVAGDPVLLFGSNMDVDFFNQDKLDAMEEVQYVFKAEDKGSSKSLRNVGAMKSLTLKVGAPVILLRNINSHLVNGMRGTVHKLQHGQDPVIEFNDKLVTLSKSKFEVYDSRKGTVIASRLQFPLKLAFALTVHRAQGQTLQNVDIDSYSFFSPGQLGVAVGRAVQLETLRVRNFNLHAATLKHPPEVYKYYEDVQKGKLSENLACCRTKIPEEINFQEIANVRTSTALVDDDSFDDDSNDGVPDDDDDDFDGDDDDDDDNDDGGDDVCTDVDEDIIDCLQEVDLQAFITKNQSLNVRKENLSAFATLIEFKLKEMLPKPGSSKDKWVSYFIALNKYLQSGDYMNSFSVMFRDGCTSQSDKNKFATRVVMYIQDALILKSAEKIDASQSSEQLPETTEEVSDAAKAKVRYVAGSCLSKISVRLRKKAISSLSSAKLQNSRRMAYKKQHMLTKLRIPEAVICKTSTEKASLAEIEHKQGQSRGLFHISDPLFCFFLELHLVLIDFLTHKNFTAFGHAIYIKCRNHIFNKKSLFQSLYAILCEVNGSSSDKDVFDELCHDLFLSLSEQYLRTVFVDRLHSIKESIPKKKKQALRAKIEGATKTTEKIRRCKRKIQSST